MKITFLIQDLFQQGAEYVTALLMRGFVDEGFDVDLVVSRVHSDLLLDSDIAPFPIPDKVNVITLPYRRARNNIFALRRYISSADTDAIVVMSVHYLPAIALASLGLKRRCKIAYVEHDLISHYKSQRGYFKIPIIRNLIRRQVDSFMSVSEGTTRELERAMKLPSGAAINVDNPVVDSVYNRKLANNPVHPWLVDKSMPTFVAAGAHCDFKRYPDLLETIKIVNRSVSVRLVLFGKGYLTDSLKQWIVDNDMTDRIDLPGYSDNLPAEFRASDGFIVSSERESFSIVLVEAMAAGVPVFSTDCPYGPPDLLKHGLYGCLVPVGDSQAMAAALLSHIKSPLPPAPPEAWQRFTLPHIVKNYRKALDI